MFVSTASLVVGVVAERLAVSAGVKEPWAYGLGPLILGLSVLGFSLVGAIVVSKRPGNRIGLLLCAIGVGLTLHLGSAEAATYLTRVHGTAPTALVWFAWLGSWARFAVFLVPFVLLRFPTDRVPSRRWSVAAGIAGGALAVVAAHHAFRPGEIDGITGAVNPVGSEVFGWMPWWVGVGLLTVTIAVFTVAVLANTWLRFRRAHGQERAQLEWLAYATVATMVVLVGSSSIPLVGFSNAVHELIFSIAVCLALNGIALAIGSAVLRYRLYDIDRVVSQTVAYGLLTVLLVGVYALGVMGGGALLRQVTTGGVGGDFLVAGSTLMAVVLFQPLRRRVQTVVDRRFNRTRYDAQRTVEAFGQRLRDEVELVRLAHDLQAVVAEAVRPARVSLWLRPTEAGEAT